MSVQPDDNFLRAVLDKSVTIVRNMYFLTAIWFNKKHSMTTFSKVLHICSYLFCLGNIISKIYTQVLWWFDDENETARIEGLVAWVVIQLRTNLVGTGMNFLTEESCWEEPFWRLDTFLSPSRFNPMWPLGINRLLVVTWLRWFLSRHLSET